LRHSPLQCAQTLLSVLPSRLLHYISNVSVTRLIPTSQMAIPPDSSDLPLSWQQMVDRDDRLNDIVPDEKEAQKAPQADPLAFRHNAQPLPSPLKIDDKSERKRQINPFHNNTPAIINNADRDDHPQGRTSTAPESGSQTTPVHESAKPSGGQSDQAVRDVSAQHPIPMAAYNKPTQAPPPSARSGHAMG
jgi:hypothetical protein